MLTLCQKRTGHLPHHVHDSQHRLMGALLHVLKVSVLQLRCTLSPRPGTMSELAEAREWVRPMSIFEKVIDIVEETVKRALVKDLLRDSSQVVHLLPTGTTELRIVRAVGDRLRSSSWYEAVWPYF